MDSKNNKEQSIFDSIQERRDFWIALLVLAVAGIFIFRVIFSNQGEAQPQEDVLAEVMQQYTSPSNSTETDTEKTSGDNTSTEEQEANAVEDNTSVTSSPDNKEASKPQETISSPEKNSQTPDAKSAIEDSSEQEKKTAASSRKDQRELLVIHSFAKSHNAIRFAQKLTAEGYDTESRERSNGWTAVGVWVDRGLIDFDALIQAIREEYDANPVLWDELE
ncbi:MAG: hypothetical protein KTR24_00780 [Saprospiraceae bacterium]|nr:hypothetical protein [Saprospiraceae bacterium]